jgi:hypothetical protein
MKAGIQGLFTTPAAYLNLDTVHPLLHPSPDSLKGTFYPQNGIAKPKNRPDF